MNRKFIQLLPFLLLAFGISAKSKGENRYSCTKNSPFFHISHSKSSELPHYNSSFGLDLPIFRSQSQRYNSFNKLLVIDPQKFNIGYQTVSVTYAGTGTAHLHFNKLFLFPFHVFW